MFFTFFAAIFNSMTFALKRMVYKRAKIAVHSSHVCIAFLRRMNCNLRKNENEQKQT